MMSELSMKLMVCLMIVIGLFAALPVKADTPVKTGPLDLSTAYQQALKYDARLRLAQADNMATKEEIAKAWSQFRPNVRVSASRGRNQTQYTGKYPGTQDFYNTVTNGFTVRQSLFNMSNIAEYKQSKSVVAKSDADLHKEEETLIVRITEAYCNALYAEDNLEFSQAHVKASLEQLQQAKRRYDKGFGTVTEIGEAQANYDMALAEGVDIANSVEFSRRELENITGSYPYELCKVVPEKMVFLPASQNGVEAWIDLAMVGNKDIVGAREEIQVAWREVQKQKAARYPTIDLVGGKSYSVSENNYSIGSTYNTYSIALQMSLPIYTGGYISASVRQAHAKWIKADEQLRWRERGTESDVRKYYNGLLGSVAQINAYEQAVKSGEIALKGTEKGFQTGLRTNADVLDAGQKLLASRRNLAKSRYQYIMNRMMLKQSAGTLFAADIDEVNNWFHPVK